MANPIVNRALADAHMDDIDHALGRPVDPLLVSYRNYYATDTGSDQAARLAKSPHWEACGVSGDTAFFRVTDEGKRALAAHLKEIKDPHRPFAVTYRGTTTVVAATSASAARKQLFLRFSESDPHLKFCSFAKNTRCVPAARGI